ncbi:MAG: phosphoribosylaminoimidazolesuccinocarboxamide synthase [Negativicoccus succinicivorans]|nr:phosphoribosylaminoimidazolesuccinocarboxamide synthase [Negativicoccus succinicivorans]KGF12062.1 phosphoribosylaminoimidazole-succinocarboxamide synthase [Tissierellia bacterium S5-A11]MBS5889629.1 phosphoribosylaminoimidazolesuccinocarboxamide synthase [Negativicoccus succinicivorans]MBS5917049.1 phosphoribosylaminoimidazolesuccinocarboxamide synthase [Negativicoccus succinicivorans]MDU0986243.1 phosphoribosylaminoimidazolesuccinocarboxamide synthase [Negativicoccus succinicivorans]MDU10
MEKLEMMYEGKAKQVFKTDRDDEVIVRYKDDATAFNGAKKGTITDKGVLNNKITTFFFDLLAKNGVPTHFIERLDDREQRVKKLSIVPLEVIIRNRCAGSMAKRYGREEGEELAFPTIEFCLKDDDLDDPLINTYHIRALNIASQEDLDTITKLAFKVNDVLKKFLAEKEVILVDFKLEFGKDTKGNILLGDEISPDTCRFWDANTLEKLDKDRFRRDLGNVEEAYHEMLRRLTGKEN